MKIQQGYVLEEVPIALEVVLKVLGVAPKVLEDLTLIHTQGKTGWTF